MFSRKICEIGLFAEKKKDKEIVKFSVAEKSGIFTRKIREIGAEKKKEKKNCLFSRKIREFGCRRKKKIDCDCSHGKCVKFGDVAEKRKINYSFHGNWVLQDKSECLHHNSVQK